MIPARCTSRHTGRRLSHLAENINKYYIAVFKSCSGIHKADCNLWQRQTQRATWSECISTVCQMAVYDVLSRETAIVWNQPSVFLAKWLAGLEWRRQWSIKLSQQSRKYIALISTLSSASEDLKLSNDWKRFTQKSLVQKVR